MYVCFCLCGCCFVVFFFLERRTSVLKKNTKVYNRARVRFGYWTFFSGPYPNIDMHIKEDKNLACLYKILKPDGMVHVTHKITILIYSRRFCFVFSPNNDYITWLYDHSRTFSPRSTNHTVVIHIIAYNLYVTPFYSQIKFTYMDHTQSDEWQANTCASFHSVLYR